LNNNLSVHQGCVTTWQLTNECLGRCLIRMFGLPMDNCLILVPLLNSCSNVPHSDWSAETTAKRKHYCWISSVCKHFPKHFCYLQPNGSTL